MASFAKRANGWRASVARQGIRKTKVFATKRAAQDWAAHEEYKILNSKKLEADVPLADMFDRYVREVSIEKRGHRWEAVRLRKMARDLPELLVSSVEPKHIAAWRDKRLREVKPGSVLREMQLLGSVFEQARKEWGLISSSPMEGVRRPPAGRPRDRLPTTAEIEALRIAAGEDLSKTTARVFHAFLFACQTAMRAGEIVGLRWDDIDLERRVAHLALTKNGTSRDVPLTSEAIALLKELPELDPVFGLKSASLDALWRKTKAKAGVKGLTFHDSRAEALTNLARKVDVLTLAKISGHRDLRILSNTYYRETAEDIARRLD